MAKNVSNGRMKAKLLRDLKGEETTTPCAVGDFQLQDTRPEMVRMRKLRAGVNMLTAKLGSAAEEEGECYDRELKEVEKWFKVGIGTAHCTVFYFLLLLATAFSAFFVIDVIVVAIAVAAVIDVCKEKKH